MSEGSAGPPHGLTEQQWKRAQRQAAKRYRRAKYRGLLDSLYAIGYLGIGAAVIVLLALAAVLIGWLLSL